MVNTGHYVDSEGSAMNLAPAEVTWRAAVDWHSFQCARTRTRRESDSCERSMACVRSADQYGGDTFWSFDSFMAAGWQLAPLGD
jgi:hypothetical protein